MRFRTSLRGIELTHSRCLHALHYVQYVQQVSSQLEALRALPLEALVQLRAPVAILLGPSTLRPKEVYVLRFKVGGGSGGGSGCDPGGK